MKRERLTVIISVTAAALGAVALILAIFFYVRDGKREPPRPPDLTGEWIQTNIEGLDYYHVASIHDGLISVYRYRPAYDDSELIWTGTYIPPETAKGSYKWDSENRVPRNQKSIYTLRNDTLAFRYENGLLAFDVSFNALLKMAVTMERWGRTAPEQNPDQIPGENPGESPDQNPPGQRPPDGNPPDQNPPGQRPPDRNPPDQNPPARIPPVENSRKKIPANNPIITYL